MNDTNYVQKFIWISERVLLFLIALATIFATTSEIIRMIDVRIVNLSDLFLLFIYAGCLEWLLHFMLITEYL